MKYSLKILFICLFAVNLFAKQDVISNSLKIEQMLNCSDKQIFINNKLIKLNKNCLGKFKSGLPLPYNSCVDTAKCLLASRSLSTDNSFKFLNNSLRIRVGKSEEFALWYNELGVYCLSKDNNYTLKKIFSFSQDLSNAERLSLISIIKLILTIQSCENSIKQGCRLGLSIS